MVRTKKGQFVELPESARPKHPVTTRNERQSWTRDDLQYLKELAKLNTPTRVMSIKLGRSEAAIRSKAKMIHLSLKPTNQSPYGLVSKSSKKVSARTSRSSRR